METEPQYTLLAVRRQFCRDTRRVFCYETNIIYLHRPAVGVDPRLFRAGRGKLLRQLLEQPALYHCEPLRQRWEAAARAKERAAEREAKRAAEEAAKTAAEESAKAAAQELAAENAAASAETAVPAAPTASI